MSCHFSCLLFRFSLQPLSIESILLVSIIPWPIQCVPASIMYNGIGSIPLRYQIHSTHRMCVFKALPKVRPKTIPKNNRCYTPFCACDCFTNLLSHPFGWDHWFIASSLTAFYMPFHRSALSPCLVFVCHFVWLCVRVCVCSCWYYYYYYYYCRFFMVFASDHAHRPMLDPIDIRWSHSTQ